MKKNEVQRRKNYRKWCQNDQEGLKHGKNGFCDEGCGTELTFWGGCFCTLFLANLLLNMQLSLDSNFFRENLLKKTKSKGEKMVENLDGKSMTKSF